MNCSQRRAELDEANWHHQTDLGRGGNIFGDCVLSDQLLTFLDRKTASRQPVYRELAGWS